MADCDGMIMKKKENQLMFFTKNYIDICSLVSQGSSISLMHG